MAGSSINSNPWIHESECFLSFAFIKSCHLSKYKLEWFGGLSNSPHRHVHVRIFSRLETSLKFTFGFLVYKRNTLRRLCSVFLFDFLKRSSTLCQIYWKPDLQSLKLVCFVLENTGRENKLISQSLCRQCVRVFVNKALTLVTNPWLISMITKSCKERCR